jgi:hypothetical protein
MGTRLRPTFELEVPAPPEQLLEHMDRRLRAADCSLCGVVTPSRIELHVPPARQHLWSPELRIEVRAEGTGSRVEGRYGPHPHVWTLFLAVYAGVSISAFFAITFAASQWLLQEPLTALYAVPILVLLAAGVRTLAFVGQGLGKAQLEELRAFLDDVIAESEVPVSAPRHSGIRATNPSEDAQPRDVKEARASGR